MATYVMGDIHGEYDQFIELLEKINLQEDDTLFMLGDYVDRGNHPIKVLLKMMEMPNVIPLLGNHDQLAYTCLDIFKYEVTEELLASLPQDKLMVLQTWLQNGSAHTISEFSALDDETKDKVLDYFKTFHLYADVNVNDQEYILVHSGLGNFSKDKALKDYSIMELLWERPDYNIPYFEDKIVISGHTPTLCIEEHPNPGYIFKGNNHIAIDCGACFPTGRLAAICLETMEEFYSSGNIDQ